MLHASNTLKMDNYGHLFPGRQAEAAARLHVQAMLNPEPTRRRETGTETVTIPALDTRRQAQRSGREIVCAPGDGRRQADGMHGKEKTRNALRHAGLSESVRADATARESEDDGARTRNHRIDSFTGERNAIFRNSLPDNTNRFELWCYAKFLFPTLPRRSV